MRSTNASTVIEASMRASGVNPSICAVVLTYNAQVDVERCLEAISAQSHPVQRILVVDNHSTDDTPAVLRAAMRRHDSLEVITTRENLGPAGGFHVALKAGVESGFELLWILDDDCRPAPDCLARLLAAQAGDEDVIVWPRVEDEFGREKWAFPAWKGGLVPRRVIERGGLPNPDFFWGVEDTEYFALRLHRQCGVRRMLVEGARVWYTSSNDRKSAPWHYYYRARNTLYYRLRLQRPRQWRKLVLALGGLWMKAILKDDRKLLKTRYMVQGIHDGLRGRLGKRLDPTKSS